MKCNIWETYLQWKQVYFYLYFSETIILKFQTPVWTNSDTITSFLKASLCGMFWSYNVMHQDTYSSSVFFFFFCFLSGGFGGVLTGGLGGGGLGEGGPTHFYRKQNAKLITAHTWLIWGSRWHLSITLFLAMVVIIYSVKLFSHCDWYLLMIYRSFSSSNSKIQN